MKICLVQTPINDFYTTEIRNIPLGLLSIGANIDRQHDVQILDIRFSIRKTIAIPEVFNELKKHYWPGDKSPFGLYKNYYRFGFSRNEFENIFPKNIDLFGISAQFTTYSENVFEIIHFLKQHRPKCKIVVGGHACAAIPGSFIKIGADYEIYGEGELALPKLINAITNKQKDLSTIPNLIWKNDNKVTKNKQKLIQNLDFLNFPDYNLKGTPTYTLSGKKHAMLMISRGCPNKCSFCCIHQVMGNQYRARSMENVLLELDQKISQHFHSFDFEDDHFGGDKAWLSTFLDKVIDKYGHLDLSFQAMNGITATNLDEEILKKMKKAGFSSLNLALVSENEIQQCNLNRPFNTKKFALLVELAEKHGFFITAYLILGLPYHTIEQMLDSILYLAKLPVLIGPSFFYLIPSTPIFDKCQLSTDLLADKRTYRSSFMPLETENFSRRDLITLFRLIRIVNFQKEIANLNIRSKYLLKDNQIILPDNINGKSKRYQLGLALIDIMKIRKKIYGATKVDKNVFELKEEEVDWEIVEKYLRGMSNF